jgi:hypothetical protein
MNSPADDNQIEFAGGHAGTSPGVGEDNGYEFDRSIVASATPIRHSPVETADNAGVRRPRCFSALNGDDRVVDRQL